MRNQSQFSSNYGPETIRLGITWEHLFKNRVPDLSQKLWGEALEFAFLINSPGDLSAHSSLRTTGSRGGGTCPPHTHTHTHTHTHPAKTRTQPFWSGRLPTKPLHHSLNPGAQRHPLTLVFLRCLSKFKFSLFLYGAGFR